MNDPVTPKVRTGRATEPSQEVAHAKALYLKALKSRLQDGSYMSPRRVDTALQRLLDAVREDLPEDPL
jgi:hypothetical protein